MYEEQMMEVIKLLEQLNSLNTNSIAIISVVIATLALIVTIIFNVISHRQYIRSLDPLLSFEFYESNALLFLSIKNTGRSEATDIKLDITEICNNGDNTSLELDDLFNQRFVLCPNEKVQGIVAFSGNNMKNNIFPFLRLNISYIKGNTNKTIKIKRTISFSRNTDEEINLYKIEDELNSIAHSNLRLANFIEGRTLFHMDRLDVMAKSSLYTDMHSAYNNSKRKEKQINEVINEREETIGNRIN